MSGAASSSPSAPQARELDSPQVRCAGPQVLSLALIDARNHALQVFAQIEPQLGTLSLGAAQQQWLSPAAWLLGEPAWFQERWIARHLQRHLGDRCDPTATPLGSLWPQADALWQAVPAPQRWATELPAADELRGYLLQTLETTLELLEHAPTDDAGLYFFRAALLHEDRQAERLIELAQAAGMALPRPMAEAFTPQAVAAREPLWLPACTWLLGSPPEGFAFAHERAQHALDVPEFEIDAQPVSWAQFVEFVDDGGYDRQEWWSSEGWAWLQALAGAEGRRGPRHVEQNGVASGAVMQLRFGQPTRLPAQAPVVHVSAWEAEAWCRWAGRRLPLEVEWEIAAETASRRGFRWGQVWEWTASSLRPYPGHRPVPDGTQAQAHFGQARVLRGGSAATRARLKSPRHREFAPPDSDHLFCGFRSCAL